MQQIPVGELLSEQSVAAATGAFERLHGHHLSSMSPDEQAEARAVWREQAEVVLGAVQAALSGRSLESSWATITLIDVGEDGVDVIPDFHPDVEQLGDEEIRGTPAQILALSALDAIMAESDEPGL